MFKLSSVAAPGLVLALALAGPAAAADKPAYAPPADWVAPAATPTPMTPDAQALRILLRDVQSHMGPDGPATYNETVYQLQTPQALAALGNIVMPWQPDTSDLTIHKLHIIRGGQVIDVLAKGQAFTVLRRENNLERAMIDGVLTATIQPEGLQVGDLLDLAFTLKRHDLAMRGHQPAVFPLGLSIPVETSRFSIVWPRGAPVRWRQTPGLPPAKLTQTPQGVRLSIDESPAPAARPPNGAPRRYADLRQVEVTDFASWAELSALLDPLYVTAATLAPDSPLRAEAAKIRAASTDPKVRAAAALRLVEDKVRYLFLGMNDGGLTPASADQTWQRLFGDCKGKTALLLALLHELGVQAEPAIVSTADGDGLDARLPVLEPFDHILVRAVIDGRVYWMDATRLGDRTLDDLQVPDFQWALPLRPAGAALEALVPTPLARPDTLTQIRIDATAGLDIPAPVHAEVTVRGDGAAQLKLLYEQLAPADVEASQLKYWRDNYAAFDAKTVSARFDPADGEERLVMDGTTVMDWEAGAWPKGRRYEADGASLGWKPDLTRDAGQDPAAPYAVGARSFTQTVETMVLPRNGAGFTVEGDPVDSTLFGTRLTRTASIAQGVFTMTASSRTVAREIPAAQARADRDAMTALSGTTVYIRAPWSYAVTDQEAARLNAAKPASLADLIARGNAMLMRGDLDQALADFSEAIRQQPDADAAYGNRALVRQQKGDQTGALADADTAIRLNPRNFAAFQARGAAYAVQGRWTESIAAYSRGLELLPANVSALIGRAVAYEQTGQWAKVVADIDEVVRLSPPTQGAVYGVRAVAHAQLNHPDLALADADKDIALSPGDPTARGLRGEVLLALGRKAEAIKDFEASLALKTTVQTYLALAALYRDSDRPRAMAQIDLAVALDPASASAREQRAGLHILAGDNKAALRDLDEAARLAPDDVALQLGRADIYLRDGQVDPAIRIADTLIAAHPDLPAPLNSRCWTRATARRDLDKALADCDAALKLAPDAANILDSRGLVHLQLGQYALSVADYDAALKLSPTITDSLFGRGLAKLRLGDKAGAQADLAAARAIDPRIDAEFAGYGLKPLP